MPGMEIKQGAIEALLLLYKGCVSSRMRGYLTNNGDVNLPRLGALPCVQEASVAVCSLEEVFLRVADAAADLVTAAARAGASAAAARHARCALCWLAVDGDAIWEHVHGEEGACHPFPCCVERP